MECFAPLPQKNFVLHPEPLRSKISPWLHVPFAVVFLLEPHRVASIQSLPICEKLELVDDLWKAVSSDLDAMELTQEEISRLVKARWR